MNTIASGQLASAGLLLAPWDETTVRTTIDEGKNAPTPEYERQRHGSREWEDQKAYIMYLLQRHTYEDAVKLLWKNRGFRIGIRQFKSKIKEWGLDQNIKASELGILMAKQQKRKCERGIGTVFLYQGTTLEESRLERFGRRRHNSTNATQNTSPSAPTPLGITYYTPEMGDLGLGDMTAIKWPLPGENVITATFSSGNAYSLRNSYIVAYDQKVEVITTYKVAHHKRPLSNHPRKTELEHRHQSGETAIAYRGRLSSRQSVQQLLWRGLDMALFLYPMIQKPEMLPKEIPIVQLRPGFVMIHHEEKRSTEEP